MPFIVGELVAPISADTRPFDRGVDSVRKQGDKLVRDLQSRTRALGTTFRQVGTQLSLFVTVPLVGAAIAATKAGDDVDKALKIIRAGTGATGEALRLLGEDFKAVARIAPEDFETIAKTLASVNARAGQTGEGLRQLTADILTLARITGADPVRSVGLLTRLFGDWSVATGDQTQVLDKLLRAVQLTDVNLEQLAGSVVAFGAPFRLLGFSLEESIALLSKWEKEGVNVETLLSGMRFALGTFARTGRDANQGFKETVARIKELGAGAEATALSFKTFGLRAANDMVAAILEGRFEIGELVTALEEGQTTVRKTGEETLSLADKFGVLRNRAKLALVPLGAEMVDALEALLPAFDRLVRATARAVRGFSGLPRPVQLTAFGLAAFAAAAGPVLFITGGIITAFANLVPMLPALSAGLLGAASGLAAFNAAALTAAAFVGFQFGKLIEPYVSEVLGLNRLLAARQPHDELVKSLAKDDDAFESARAHLVRLRKALGLTGDEWRVSSERTAENARRLVELTERARQLNAEKIKERAAVEAAAAAQDAGNAAAEAGAKLSDEQREAIDKTIAGLEARNLELKLGADRFVLYTLAQSGASESELAYARQLLETGAALRQRELDAKKQEVAESRRLASIDRIVAALESEYDGLVQSREALLLQDLATQGATKAEIGYAESLIASIAAQRKRAEADQDAEIVRQRIASLDEQQAAELERLAELYGEAALTAEEYGRAVEEVQGRYSAMQKAQEDAGEGLERFAERARRDLQSAFVDFFEATDDGFDAMVGSFKRALRRMLAELFASQLMKFFTFLASNLLSFGAGAGNTFNKPGSFGNLVPEPVAGGGLITGTGTGTSDSIAAQGPGGRPLRVSSGEYIVKASAVRRVGVGFLDALNSAGGALEAFANGGAIAARASGFAGGASLAPGKAATMQFNYAIDARGAAPGVQRSIVSALRKTEDQAVRRAVREVANSRLRGGNFARAFD